MGFDHAILAIEAHGNKIINLKIPGLPSLLEPGRQATRLGLRRP